jgi:hypothetical protein
MGNGESAVVTIHCMIDDVDAAGAFYGQRAGRFSDLAC